MVLLLIFVIFSVSASKNSFQSSSELLMLLLGRVMMRPFFHWHGNVENEPLKNKLDGTTRYNSITFSNIKKETFFLCANFYRSFSLIQLCRT